MIPERIIFVSRGITVLEFVFLLRDNKHLGADIVRTVEGYDWLFRAVNKRKFARLRVSLLTVQAFWVFFDFRKVERLHL